MKNWRDAIDNDADLLAFAELAGIGFDFYPDWIEAGITATDIAAICRNGCASGAYLLAVICHAAARTMHEHGDEVIEYIIDELGDLPKPSDAVESWQGLAVFYLSMAVELWASGVESMLENWEMDE